MADIDGDGLERCHCLREYYQSKDCFIIERLNEELFEMEDYTIDILKSLEEQRHVKVGILMGMEILILYIPPNTFDNDPKKSGILLDIRIEIIQVIQMWIA